MESSDALYCNRVIRLLTQVSGAAMALHGRDLHNMFGLYGRELQLDIHQLVTQRYMGTELQPLSPEDMVILPGMAFKNARRMRYLWDYFIYLDMSHKIHNIKRRQTAAGSRDFPTILYLRGADCQIATARQGAGVGHSTMSDAMFCARIVSKLRDRFDVAKSLSPSDLTWAMKDLGPFLAQHGNYLSNVSEFARNYNGGWFLNPASWKDRIELLFPSTSLFLVYVSKQSKGLSHELEKLTAAGLEANAILVLDENRFAAMDSLFALQDGLTAGGEDLYVSVDRNATMVEDPERFEQLISRFPHRIVLGDDSDAVLREIEALIPLARRQVVDPPEDFPFEFHVVLDDDAKDEVASLRRHVGDFIEASLSGETVSNWPVLLLHIELDMFLSVAHGEIVRGATLAARYGAMADFMRELLKQKAPERVADLDDNLRKCGNIGMNIAYDAFSIGSWNDFEDRRTLSRERMDAVAGEVIELMRRSVDRAGRIMMREPRPEQAS
jgi:hypothetical protein